MEPLLETVAPQRGYDRPARLGPTLFQRVSQLGLFLHIAIKIYSSPLPTTESYLD